jgi:hypothetical protein
MPADILVVPSEFRISETIAPDKSNIMMDHNVSSLTGLTNLSSIILVFSLCRGNMLYFCGAVTLQWLLCSFACFVVVA